MTPVKKTSSAITITVSAGTGTNYIAADNKTFTVTVAAFTPTVSLSAKTEAQRGYTGNPISANTATVTLTNSETYSGSITYTYYTNSSCSTGSTTTAPTYGNYWVKASIAANGNYSAASSSCVNHNIVAATPTVSLSAKTGMIYNGSAQAANTATVSPNGGGSITYTYYTNSSCTSGATTTAPIDAGQYYVKASVAAVTNKTNAASSSCVSHKIEKYTPSITLSAASGSVAVNEEKTFTATPTTISACSGALLANSSNTSIVSIPYNYMAFSPATSGTAYEIKYIGKSYSTGTNLKINFLPEDEDNCNRAVEQYFNVSVSKINNSLTINCANLSYTGSAQQLISSVTVSGGTPYYKVGTQLTSSNYSSTGSTETSSVTGINATSYTIYYYVPTTNVYNELSGSKSCSISTATPTVSLSAKTGMTYNGSSQAANTATVSPDGGGAITYTYYTNSSCTSGATTTAPIDAGQYYVKASVAAVTNKTNAASSNCISHKINPKEVSVTWGDTTEFTYNGSAQGPTATASTGVTGEIMTLSITSETGAGTHTATATCGSVTGGQTKCNNYSLANNTLEYTINKYKPTLAISANTGSVNVNATKTFTATPTTISVCQGTLTAVSTNTDYVTITSGESYSNVPSGTAKTITYKGIAYTAGTSINVNYVPTDTNNCDRATQKQFSASVARIDNSITVNCASLTYSGASQQLVSSFTISGGTLYFSVGTQLTSSNYTTSGSTGITTLTGTNAGSYTIYYYAAATSTYKSISGSTTCSIGKYTPSISLSASTGTVNYDSSTTFTATPTTISNCQGTLTAASAGTSYVSITGGASNSNVASGTAKTITWKGVGYTTGTNINVNYAPTDTNNCNSAAQVQYNAKVNKINASCPSTLTAYSGIYDGNNHSITASGHSGGTLQYRTATSGDGSTWTTTLPTRKNVGTTTVYVQVAGDSNHNTVDCGSKTITISQREVTVTAPTMNSNTLIYKNDNHTLTANAGSCSAGGTMYYYTNNYTTTSAPTFATSGAGWTTSFPSANGWNAGTYYLWYYCYVSDTTNNKAATGSSINTALNVTKTIEKYTPVLSDPTPTSANVDLNSTGSFSITPTARLCRGNLIATSSNANYVTLATTSNGTYAVNATHANAANGSEKTFYYKGTGYTTGNTITISYVPSDTANCNNAETKTVSISVNKINAICPALTSYSGTYDESTHTITVGTATGGTIKYRTNTSDTWTETKPTRVSAGTTTVYVEVEGDSNHNTVNCYESGTTNATITISQREVTVTAPTVVSGTLTYSGSAQNLLSTAGSCTSGGTMYYWSSNPSTSQTSSPSWNGGTGWTTTAPTSTSYKGTNAGTYYMWYYCYISDTTNNKGATGSSINTALSVTKEISKYTPSISISASSGSVAYNSTNTFTAAPTTISGCQGTLTAASTGTSYVSITDGASYSDVASETAKTITYKGMCYTTGTNINLNYTPTNTNNCNSASQKVFTASVTKLPQSVALSAKTAIYTGSPISANTATANGGGTITYNYYTNSSCTTPTTTEDGATDQGEAPANVGQYYVKASATGTTCSYNEGTSSCVAHTINNATITPNKGNCSSISSSTALYTRTGATGLYSGIRNTTSASLPTVTVAEGYQFNGWYTASGSGSKILNSDGSLTGTAVSGYTSATAYTITENKTFYANCSPKDYTINYYQGNGTGTAGNTLLGSTTCTFGSSCSLKTYQELGATFPLTANGWSFYGWSTGQTSTTKTYTDGQSINPTSYSETINIYALGTRNVTFSTGIEPTTVSSTLAEYWVPYSTATTNVSGVTIPAATDLSDYDWEFVGYSTNNTASSTVNIAASNVGTSYKISPSDTQTYRSVYQRTLTVIFNANGGSGTEFSDTATQYYNSGYGTGSENSGANTSCVIFNLADDIYTMPGYDLANWAEDSSEGEQHAAGQNWEWCPDITDSTSKIWYAIWNDVTDPTCTLSSTTDPKTGTQTLTATFSDTGSGVVGWYIGTSTSPTYNTINVTSSETHSINVSSAGTYRCYAKDASNNVSVSSSSNQVEMYAYTVKNMLVNVTGTETTYSTNNYAQASTANYIVPKDTALTLANLYTTPNGALTSTYKGYSIGAPSTSGATINTGTSYTLSSNNTTIATWFGRKSCYFKAVAITSCPTVLVQSSNNTTGVTATTSSNNKSMTVRYGESLTATGTPGTGLSWTGWDGVLAGQSNPTNPAITVNDTYCNTNSSSPVVITPQQCYDQTPPTCQLQATSSYIEFKSSSDNVAVTGWKVTTSNAQPSSWESSAANAKVSVAAGNYYGWVKDAAGNISGCTNNGTINITAKGGVYTCTKAANPLYICTHAATPTYTCQKPATVASSNNVTCNTKAKYDSPSTQCASGYTYAGNNCSVSYSCPNGGTLSGSTCTYNASVLRTYCKASGSAYYSGSCYCSCSSDSICWAPESITVSSTSYNNCSSYCRFSYPSSGWTVGSGSLSANYSCPSGLSNYNPGSVCYGYISGYATCPGSWSLNTYYATNGYEYYCPNGGTASGTTCSYSATPTYSGTINCNTYSCTEGTVSGTNCVTSGNVSSCPSTWTANPTTATGYNCSVNYSGSTLSGSNCVKDNQTATISGWTCNTNGSYTCLDGGTLSGSTCTKSNQTATISGWTCNNTGDYCNTGAVVGSYCYNHVYGVTLDQQSGSGTSPTKIYYSKGTNAYYSDPQLATAITKITNPTRTGYTFGGYYSATGGGGTQYITNASDGGVPTNSLYNKSPVSDINTSSTLYAKWTPHSYTLTISQGSGSTITVNRTSSTGGSTGNLSNGATIYYDDVLSITIAANTGYTIGTHTVNSTTWTSGNHTVTGNVTVTSTATINSYTITFNCNGGSGSNTTNTYNYGTNAATQTKSCGYKITTGTSGKVYYQTGWATSSTGSATDPLTVTGATTLFATWGNLFTYAGSYNVINDGSGNWRVKMLTVGSKNLVMNSSTAVDIFVVGGGGGGGSSGNSSGNCNYVGGGGGGGGYTKTCSNQTASGTISITVGDGGAGSSTAAVASTGGTSSFGSLCSAAGGVGGGYGGATRRKGGAGGNGGSGGGGGASGYYQNSAGGGSNGANGGGNTTSNEDTQGTPGIGCTSNNVCKLNSSNCTNTREFCESGGTTYSGGGSGGLGSGASADSIATIGTPGTPGGGAGGASHTAGNAGTANTGGGGGGAGSHTGTGSDVYKSGGKGGSGIVIMRNHRS